MCMYVMAGSELGHVIEIYTSIVGRPWLKPRYALGYSQGAYGYDTQDKMEAAMDRYHQEDFPIDTMHVDVDMQNRYCVFIIDEEAFPNARAMFTQLRELGVKCSTNITPAINATVSYSVQQELLEKKFYIPDRRHLAGISTLAKNQRYVWYDGGERSVVDPNLDQPDFGDEYDLAEHFNNQSGPYYGGVNYGAVRGTARYYPDLNCKVVRKWWVDQSRYLFETGVSFVWQT